MFTVLRGRHSTGTIYTGLSEPGASPDFQRSVNLNSTREGGRLSSLHYYVPLPIFRHSYDPDTDTLSSRRRGSSFLPSFIIKLCHKKLLFCSLSLNADSLFFFVVSRPMHHLVLKPDTLFSSLARLKTWRSHGWLWNPRIRSPLMVMRVVKFQREGHEISKFSGQKSTY